MSVQHALIRGGRLKRTARGIVSLAPFLASVSAFALSMVAPAEAGMCTGGTVGANVQPWTCSGAANSASDSTVTIQGQVAQRGLEITDEVGFGLDVSTGKGIEVTTSRTNTSVALDLDGNISAQNEAIDIDQDGTGAVSVTTDGAIASSAEEGIYVQTASVTGDVTIVANGNVSSSAAKSAISVLHPGLGSIMVTTGANSVVTTTAGNYGMNIRNTRNVSAANADIIITVNGDIGTSATDSNGGMRVAQGSVGNLVIEVNGDIFTSNTGVNAFLSGQGTQNSITINGSVNGGSQLFSRGLRFRNSENTVAQNSAIEINGDVSASTGVLIDVEDANDSATTTINASVAGTRGTAVDLNGAGTHTLVLATGASFTGRLDASGATGTTNFQLGGTGSGTFDLGTLSAGFDDILKNTEATWTITGTQASRAAFASANINAGTLVWNTTSSLQATSATIADGATLEITQANTQWGVSSTLSGRIAFTGASSSASFGAVTASNGNIDIDVDFSGGSVTLTTARFSATSVDGTIPVNIRAMGGSAPSQQVTISNLIAVADSDAFTAGMPLNGGFTFDLQYDTANTRWDLVATPATTGGGDDGGSDGGDGNGGSGGGENNGGDGSGGNDDSGGGSGGDDNSGGNNGEDSGGNDGNRGGNNGNNGNGDGSNGNGGGSNGGGGGSGGNDGNRGGNDGENTGIRENIGIAFFEMLPMALAQLSRIESLHERVQSKRFQGADDVGTWARVKGGTVEMNPGISTYSAGFRTQNTDLEFGADVPLGPVTIGASVAFGSVESEVFRANATGDILTNTIAASLSATWKYQGFYADAQGRYVDFSNDMEADGEGIAEDMSANAISAGLELGYGIDVNGLQVTSSAQTWWSGVDFDDFTSAGGATIALEDGEVMFGRVGILLEREVEHIVWHGYGNVIMPLDGEMAVDVDEAKMLSESKEAVFDAGVGMAYDWDDGAYVGLLGISTQQGKEIEGYSASVELKVAF